MVDAAARHVEGAVELHRVGEAEVEPVLPFGDHDRVAAPRGEVEVVGIADGHRFALRPPGDGAEGRQAVADIVVDPERLEVVRRRHMLGEQTNRVVRDDLEGPLVDHVHRVACAVRDINARRYVSNGRAEIVHAVVGVDVERQGCRAPAR